MFNHEMKDKATIAGTWISDIKPNGNSVQQPLVDWVVELAEVMDMGTR